MKPSDWELHIGMDKGVGMSLTLFNIPPGSYVYGHGTMLGELFKHFFSTLEKTLTAGITNHLIGCFLIIDVCGKLVNVFF